LSASNLKETVEPYWDRAGVLNKIDFRIAPALESLAALAEGHAEATKWSLTAKITPPALSKPPSRTAWT
jgi:hypothetical protein